MLDFENLEKIKKIINEFFKKTSFEVGLELLEQKDQTIYVKIKTEEPKILIGQNGQTLFEIQHLLKAILRRQINTFTYLDIDINNYKEKKNDYLREFARALADEVSISRKERSLSPMPASERRIIHLELKNRADITTESIGEGQDRRLIIRPA